MDYWVDTDRIFLPGERESFPLVHMTQKWEILKLILREGFKPSYCRENITNDIETKSACFPMISFSNVTYDFAISYQRSYGALGIVLDKKWGEENDFNPVLYLERKSDLTNDIISNFKNIAGPSKEDLKNSLEGIANDFKDIMIRQHIKIFGHSKNYDGRLVRNSALLAKKYPFGMEREWRKIIREENIPYFLVGDEIERKDEYNKLIKDIRIDYKLENLKIIIVESDWQSIQVKEIICKKFEIEDFPKNIDVRINRIRHVQDEG